jgi:hypothetical protein
MQIAYESCAVTSRPTSWNDIAIWNNFKTIVVNSNFITKYDVNLEINDSSEIWMLEENHLTIVPPPNFMQFPKFTHARQVTTGASNHL